MFSFCACVDNYQGGNNHKRRHIRCTPKGGTKKIHIHTMTWST